MSSGVEQAPGRAQQAPGLYRTDLQEHDLSVPGRQVIQNLVDRDRLRCVASQVPGTGSISCTSTWPPRVWKCGWSCRSSTTASREGASRIE